MIYKCFAANLQIKKIIIKMFEGLLQNSYKLNYESNTHLIRQSKDEQVIPGKN